MSKIIDIPRSERAHARYALRKHFDAGRRFTPNLRPWLARWLGSFESRTAYVASELEEILAPRDLWIAAYVDVDALSRDWEDGCRVLIMEDRRGRVHVFAWQGYSGLISRPSARHGFADA